MTLVDCFHENYATARFQVVLSTLFLFSLAPEKLLTPGVVIKNKSVLNTHRSVIIRESLRKESQIQMEKIVNKFGEALKSASKEERDSLKEEFLKAQKDFLKKAPTPEDFLKIIDSLKDMSEEDREKLKRNFAERAFNSDKLKDMFKERKTMELASMDYVVFIGMLALVVFVIGESLSLLSVG